MCICRKQDFTGSSVQAICMIMIEIIIKQVRSKQVCSSWPTIDSNAFGFVSSRYGQLTKGIKCPLSDLKEGKRLKDFFLFCLRLDFSSESGQD